MKGGGWSCFEKTGTCSEDDEKDPLLTRPAPARQDAPFPMLRSRLIEILNVPHLGKELFQQLGVGWVGTLRFRFRLASGLVGWPF
jgi:hypothetical protein